MSPAPQAEEATLLILDFEGWAQCRLATDPDPSDEPRGVTGWTFAVAGEPDLDRVIRFQEHDGRPRVPGPQIGVTVQTATIDGRKVDGLIGAEVDLLEGPVFEGRNGLAYEDVSEPIVPLHLSVSAKAASLARRHVGTDGQWLAEPGRFTATPQQIAERLDLASSEDFVRFRAKRLSDVREALKSNQDPVRKVALKLREAWLSDPPVEITTDALGFGMSWHAELAGPEPVADTGSLGIALDTGAPWVLDLWMGAWDADALCSYVSGRLAAPTR